MIYLRDVLNYSLSLHIFWGILSLSLFWLAFVFRKKNLLHMKIGKLFFNCLVLNLFFSIVVCLILIYDPLLKYHANFALQSKIRTLMLVYLTLMPFITAKLAIDIQTKVNVNFKLYDVFYTIFFIFGIFLLGLASTFKLFNVIIITGILSPLIYTSYINFKKETTINLKLNKKLINLFHLKFINYSGAALHIATFSGGPAVKYFGLKNSFTGLSFFIPFTLSLLIDFLLIKKINNHSRS